jgi:hypothetical protein
VVIKRAIVYRYVALHVASVASSRASPAGASTRASSWDDIAPVVERALAWLNRFRRLTVRYERRADIHQAFLSLGCALMRWQALNR